MSAKLTENAAGRSVPTEINGAPVVPFQGVGKFSPTGHKASPAIRSCADYPPDGNKVAADLLTRAAAPGNSFAFLMTGVSTDYTEIMVLKETTASWSIPLLLPLITVPQVVVLALIMNTMI